MKKNSKKLLLLLWSSPELGPRLIIKERLQPLFPDLTMAGWNSLILQLLRRGALVSEKSKLGEYLRITDLGRRMVSDVFPALSSTWRGWKGEWGAVIFLTPPKTDSNFRLLRAYLVKQGLRAVTRGWYVYPWPLPDTILQRCRSEYGPAVGVTKLSDWTVSDFRAIITSVYGVFDLFSLYSGISKEIDYLLMPKHNRKGLNYQSKNQIGNIFDRFLQTLAADPGFFAALFPQDLSGEKILLKLHLLVDQT